MSNTDRDALAEILPKAVHSKIPAILAYMRSPECEFTTVEVIHARVAVEQIEAYGLIIDLDANGNAVAVMSGYGLLVADYV